MKKLILLGALLLSGCATTQLIPQEKIPESLLTGPLMEAPGTIAPIAAGPDGTIKANEALAVVTANYGVCEVNSVRLADLQAAILKAQAELDRLNKEAASRKKSK